MKNNIIFFGIVFILTVIIGLLTILGLATLSTLVVALLIGNNDPNGAGDIILILPAIVSVAIGGFLAIILGYFAAMYISNRLYTTRFRINHPKRIFMVAAILSPVTFYSAIYTYFLLWPQS